MIKKHLVFLALFLSPAIILGRLVPVKLVEADQAYAERMDLDRAKQALDLYQELIEEDSENVEYYWKAARTAWWLGDKTKKKKEKLKKFQMGVDLAKKGIELDPDSAASHYWLAGNYGSFGESKGIMKSLSLVKPIRKELEEVNRIDEKYDGGGGHRILGIMDYKIPRIAGGNKKRALQRLTKAYEIDPNNSATLYYMAEYYKVVRKKDKAKEFLRALFDLNSDGPNSAGIKSMQVKGEKLLKKLGGF